MDRIPIWVLFISLFLLLHGTNSEEDQAKRSLVKFFEKISNSNGPRDPSWGWNSSSDPCTDHWKGVSCDARNVSVKRIIFDGLNMIGNVDASSLCTVRSLSVLSLNNNNITGDIPEEIGNCKQLTHLYISGNQLSGNLPYSLSKLNNLKRLEIFDNSFSGKLPDLARISGLVSFLAQNNNLSGEIPQFDFTNLVEFNVSFNNFSGAVPNLNGKFGENSVMGNPELCGEPLSKACPPSQAKKKFISIKDILIYSGYIILAVVVVILIALKLFKRKKSEEEKVDVVKKGAALDNGDNKPSTSSGEYKTGGNRSEYSITSAESGMVSSSLVLLTSPVVKDLKFEDLLKAPAELLGRGRHGSLYKVIFEDGMTLAVKRIKDWAISSEDFKRRMEKLDQVKHPNVLPAVAFYSSKQEKLVVYEYQQNGSLHTYIHGTQNGQTFDWGSRLSVAASIGKGLAFMHDELREDGIAHGNLKSSNIMMNQDMYPCISEYGLMVVDNQDQSSLSLSNSYKAAADDSIDRIYSTFKVDIYGFGVILLELLTGKLVQNNGFNLARWVHSVVREEWTAEVFDKTLISEGASEERMVNLLQIALKCINPSPEARPSINQVVVMINAIKEEEERSMISEV